MKELIPLLLTATATTTSAWTFTWRNASDSPFIKNSHDPMACTNIEHAKGKEFDFHPEKDDYNFYIWSTNNCTGGYAGYTTPVIWRKKASTDMRSYLVDYGDGSGPIPKSSNTATATSSSTTTSSTSSTSTTSASETSTTSSASASSTTTSAATASASSSPDSNGTVISGGAIAGIVIAVVAGLSILGAGFFYLGRRARRANAHIPPGPSHSQPPPPPLQNMYANSIPPSSSHGHHAGDSSFGAVPPYGQTQAQKETMMYYGDSSPLAPPPHPQHMDAKLGTQKAWVELPGDEMMTAELSGSRQVNELEGHSKMRYQ